MATVEGIQERHLSADPESTASWIRLIVALVIGAVGSIGMWSYVVVLPAVQADFGVDRATASLPFSATMLGFATGGILMGRLSDRVGIFVPVVIGALALFVGFIAAGLSQTLWQFALAQGLLIGMLGSSAVFGPLMADVSRWFLRRRGLAVGICSCGNYIAGTIWPPFIEHFTATAGWRATHIGIGIVCIAVILPLAFLMRRAPPPMAASPADAVGGVSAATGVSPGALQGLLLVAGLACCMAMAMPQVHLVAYCGDLGYGPARGAEMLSLMLGFGIISRLVSGWIFDRIGGLATLLLSSVLQGVALVLYLPFDGLASLYVVSALFGLFQGGIVPAYTIVIREYFPAREAGVRIGLVLFATLIGMALGGWASGRIFDLTGSYQAAFVHGIAWNLLNMAIATWLLLRVRGRARMAAARVV